MNPITSCEQLTEFLKPAFPTQTHLACTGNLYHITIHIIDSCFENLSSLKRQQKVYAVLKPLIANQTLHAVTIVAKTPAENSENLQS